MKRNQYQVKETWVSDSNGNDKRIWSVIDRVSKEVIDSFPTQAYAKYYASWWSKKAKEQTI